MFETIQSLSRLFFVSVFIVVQVFSIYVYKRTGGGGGESE